MALGDVVTDVVTISAGAIYNIKPASGQEWVIHNMLYNGAIEMYKTNGTLDVLYDSDALYGGRINLFLHVTSSVYLKVKNTSGTPITFSYDGIQTK